MATKTKKTGVKHKPSTEHLKPPWKPGQSGNPKGRPKQGFAIADLLNEIGNEKVPGKKITKRRKMLEVAYEQAMKGNKEARAFIADRTEGKALERIRQEIMTMPFTGENPEEYVRSKIPNGD